MPRFETKTFWVTPLFALLLLASGCTRDLNSPQYWEKEWGQAKHSKARIQLLDNLKETGKLQPSFLPFLHRSLQEEKQGEVKAALARALGELRDESSIDALSQAIDLSDTSSASNAANRAIAAALGKIAVPRTAPALLHLLNAKEPYVRIDAIDALGSLHALEAEEPLIALAEDDAEEVYLTKKAIQALGAIGDPRAIPVLSKTLFKERKGVTFFSESSLALFKIGKPADDSVLKILNGDDAEFWKWAQSSGVIEAAIYAKTAQLVADFNDSRAIPKLMSLLGYKNEMNDLTLFVRTSAAESLGRLRYDKAATLIISLLKEDDPGARAAFAHSLVLLGIKAVPAPLLKLSSQSEERNLFLPSIALLGGASEIAAIANQLAVPPGVTASLKASIECGHDKTCWVKRLDDPASLVRVRAAYELGRSKDPSVALELLKRSGDSDPDAREAIIQGATWIVQDSAEAARTAKSFSTAIEKQLEAEKSKTQMQKLNEDLRRLAWTISRA